MALRTQAADGSRGGMWPWLGQRVTAVLVLVTIAVHLILTHYIAIGELSFADVVEAELADGDVKREHQMHHDGDDDQHRGDALAQPGPHAAATAVQGLGTECHVRPPIRG